LPIELKEELVLLCEGEADKNFFRKLIQKREGLPRFDIPFPFENLGGKDAFAKMLRAIRGDRHGFARIRGLLIVADSADDPMVSFQTTCDQIRQAEGYGIPAAPLDLASRTPGHPPLAVMLLPDESTPGGLETLCIQEIAPKSPWITTCVDQFLRCEQIQAHDWPPEKLDKARYHSMVAALNRSDPGRALSRAFKDPAPLIAVEAACFNSVELRLRNFSAAVAAL
jgi:hypothetical protein